ncbi:TPA: hypothetical protein DEP21_00340 [Patescibacteria group bacterium]|nr:hypothetical protein [Candidatus Gracilibacteria bacterium]
MFLFCKNQIIISFIIIVQSALKSFSSFQVNQSTIQLLTSRNAHVKITHQTNIKNFFKKPPFSAGRVKTSICKLHPKTILFNSKITVFTVSSVIMEWSSKIL